MNNQKKRNYRGLIFFFLLLAAAILVATVLGGNNGSKAVKENISYSQFLQEVKEEKIDSVLIIENRV